MNMEIERLLQTIKAYTGYVGEITALVLFFYGLVCFHNKVLPKKYKYLQKKLASAVVWAAVSVAVVWLAWKKNIPDIIMEWFGISETEVPLIQGLWNFFYEKSMRFSVNMILGICVAVYMLWKMIRILTLKKSAEKERQESQEDTAQEQEKNMVSSILHKISEEINTDAYQYDGAASVYVLKQEFVQVRTFYQYLFIAESLLFGVVKCIIENTERFEEVFVMVIALFLYTWEKYDYYNGYTLEEYKKLYGQEKDYAEIGRELLKQAADALKTILVKEETEENSAEQVFPDEGQQESASEAEKRILEIQCSENYRERCMGYYWYQTLAAKENIHIDLLEAALKLAGHQSVYFSSPFYHDLGPYIFPFLNLELLENKKILIISGTQDKEEQLKNWMISGLQSKYGKIVFWKVENMQEEINTADIGIVSLRHMNEIMIDNDSYGFWKKVSVVILLEPSCFVLSHPVMVSQLLSKLQISREKLTYIVCDRNGEGMVDWLSHTLKEELIAVNAVFSQEKNFHLVADMDSELSLGEFPYKNICIAGQWELSALLGRPPLERVQWYGNRMIPIWDIADEIKRYSEYFKGIAGSVFEFYEDGNESAKRECACSVTEDAVYNLGEMLRQYAARGYRMSFTVVCSPHYMLRNFMVSHMKQMIHQLIPEFICSERNMAIAAGYELVKGNKEWADLKKILQYYGADTEEKLSCILKRLNVIYDEVLGLDKMWVAEDCFHKEEPGQEKSRRIMVSTEEGRQQFSRWYDENMNAVLYQNESMSESERYLEAVAGGHVYQYYLPGQFLTVEGKYYRIDEILSGKGRRIMKLKRASDSYKYRRYYRQIRKYCLKEDTLPERSFMQREGICAALGHAEISVQTEGYLCSRRFFDLEKADKVPVYDIPARIYKKKAFLKISTPNPKICMQTGVLLKEMLYTLFPYCWQLLSVAVDKGWEQNGIDRRLDALTWLEQDKNPAESAKENMIYIIEDSPMDLGLLEAIGNQFEMILRLMHQYAEWGRNEGKEDVREYFGDELLEKMGFLERQ